MVIHHLYIGDAGVAPSKANPPLIVDANAVLAFHLALQRFQPVGGRNAQVVEPSCVIDHAKLSPCDRLDRNRQAARHFAIPNTFCLLVGEAQDHK